MTSHTGVKLPITVLLAAKNEAINLPRCLAALGPATYVVVLDSHSTDATAAIALAHGAAVVQFDYHGGYPKKRQWALENLVIGEHRNFQVVVDKPFVDGCFNRQKLHFGFQFFKNSSQAIELLGIIRTDIGFITRCLVLVQLPDQQVEIFIKRRLWRGMGSNGRVAGSSLGGLHSAAV